MLQIPRNNSYKVKNKFTEEEDNLDQYISKIQFEEKLKKKVELTKRLSNSRAVMSNKPPYPAFVTLAIIQLAFRLSNHPIFESDLISLIQNNNLTYAPSIFMIDSSLMVNSSPWTKILFPPFTLKAFHELITKITKFLGVKKNHFNHSPLIKRYVDDLAIPFSSQVFDIATKLCRRYNKIERSQVLILTSGIIIPFSNFSNFPNQNHSLFLFPSLYDSHGHQITLGC